jgi:hypothetical protein
MLEAICHSRRMASCMPDFQALRATLRELLSRVRVPAR